MKLVALISRLLFSVRAKEFTLAKLREGRTDQPCAKATGVHWTTAVQMIGYGSYEVIHLYNLCTLC
jgi:hypothetical protein